MKIIYRKSESDAADLFNQIMGTSYRSETYDFNNPNDLKEAFWISAARYIDYFSYSLQLDRIVEKFDETMEHYDTLSYIARHREDVNSDESIDLAEATLAEASYSMSTLADSSKAVCLKLFKNVLQREPDIVQQVLGDIYSYDEENITELFDYMVDFIDDDTYSMHDVKAVFKKAMNFNWGIEEGYDEQAESEKDNDVENM